MILQLIASLVYATIALPIATLLPAGVIRAFDLGDFFLGERSLQLVLQLGE